MIRIFTKVAIFLLLLSEGTIGQKVTEVITEGINGERVKFPITNPGITFPNQVRTDLTDDGVSNPRNMRKILDVTRVDVDWQVINEFQLIKVNRKKESIISIQVEMDEDGHTHIFWYRPYGFYKNMPENPARERGMPIILFKEAIKG